MNEQRSCRGASAGGVRAGSEGGRGLGMTRSSSAAMAARTTPNSSSRAAATSCRFGGSGRSRSGLRVIQRRRRGRALHSLRACRWRSSAAASFSPRQRRFSPAASVERAERGAASLNLFEDRSVSRRRPRPGADRLGDRDDGVCGQRDVSPLPVGRPSGRDQLAGLAPLLPCPLGRGGECRFDITAPRNDPDDAWLSTGEACAASSELAPAPTRRAASPSRVTPAARAARRRWQGRRRDPRASA